MSSKPMAILLAGTAPFLSLTACKSREEVAKKELQQSGYDFTPEAWFRAAESDDITAMEQLQSNGMPLDTRNAAGDNALHAAAAAGMKKSADFLLDRNVPVDVTGADSRTPLMIAVVRGTPDMVRYLLSQKANPHLKDAHGYSPLMLAVKEGRGDMVAELAPFDRTKLDDALLVASLEGKASAIDALTAYGASIFARMDDGRTPLMLAAENGHVEAVDLLLDVGANRFSMDEQGRIAADYARESGYETLAMRLAEAPPADEFALEEPSELGESMVAGLDQQAAPDSGGAAIAQGPGSPAGIRELDGVVLEAPPVAAAPDRATAPAGAGGSPVVPPGQTPEVSAAPLVMRAFRQKELPVWVETVQEQKAVLRLPGDRTATLAAGETIPGSRLRIVNVRHRMAENKDEQGMTEVSVVEVEDTSNGRTREWVAGREATAHDPVAVVEDGGGRRYLATEGQTFTDAGGTEFRVADIRPNQMVIENLTSGEVITVPLRGPRG